MASEKKPGAEIASSRPENARSKVGRAAELARQDSARKARLAAALKANLHKRKKLARQRVSADEQPDPDALLPHLSCPNSG